MRKNWAKIRWPKKRHTHTHSNKKNRNKRKKDLMWRQPIVPIKRKYNLNVMYLRYSYTTTHTHTQAKKVINKHMWNQNRGYWTPNLHFVTLNFAQAKGKTAKKTEEKWILWVPYQKMSMRADTHKQMIDCSSVPVSQLVLSTLNANSVRAKRYHFADCRLFFSCLWCVHLRVCVWVWIVSFFPPNWNDFPPDGIDFKIITSSCWS